jgi:hypothetical protein
MPPAAEEEEEEAPVTTTATKLPLGYQKESPDNEVYEVTGYDKDGKPLWEKI